MGGEVERDGRRAALRVSRSRGAAGSVAGRRDHRRRRRRPGEPRPGSGTARAAGLLRPRPRASRRGCSSSSIIWWSMPSRGRSCSRTWRRSTAQLANGDAVALPAKTSSFKAWSERLSRAVREGGFDSAWTRWVEVPVGPGRAPRRLPRRGRQRALRAHRLAGARGRRDRAPAARHTARRVAAPKRPCWRRSRARSSVGSGRGRCGSTSRATPGGSVRDVQTSRARGVGSPPCPRRLHGLAAGAPRAALREVGERLGATGRELVAYGATALPGWPA